MQRKGVEQQPPNTEPNKGMQRRRGKSLRVLQDQALEFFIKGYTYIDIGNELGVSVPYANILVKKAMDRWKPALGLEIKDWTNKQLMQIQSLYAKHAKIAEAGSWKSAEICIKLLDLEAELIGTKNAPQTYVAPPAEIEYDVTALTVTELKQLETVLVRLKPAALPAPAPASRSPDVVDGEYTEVEDAEEEAEDTAGEDNNG